MIVYPDTTIFNLFIFKHPLFFLAFIIFLSPLFFFYFKKVITLSKCKFDTIIYVIILLLSTFHFISLALLVIVYQATCIIYNETSESKRQWQVLMTATVAVVIITLGWIAYFNATVFIDLGFSKGGLSFVRKLFNYPKVYENVFIPILQLGIVYEFLLFIAATLFVILYRFLNLHPIEKKEQQKLAVSLFIIIACFSATGIAKSDYSHIRYFYYLYPLMLIIISVAIKDSITILRNYASFCSLIFIGMILYSLWQISFTWNHIIMAHPGDKEPFSYSRSYIDYKTCCVFLKQSKKKGDLVIAFASAHQSSVYCGIIDICTRPPLTEHTGEKHYVTGSYYYDSVDDLINLVEREGSDGSSVWIIYHPLIFGKDSWEYKILDQSEDSMICKSGDGETRLFQFKINDFLIALRQYKSIAAKVEIGN